MSVRIGELALAAGAVTADQLEQASAHQKETGGRLGASLVALRLMSERQVAEVVARRYGLAVVEDLDGAEVAPEVLGLVPRSHCVAHHVVPLSRHGSELRVAVADPTDVVALDPIQFRTGLRVRPLVAAESAIARAARRLYGEDASLARVDGRPAAKSASIWVDSATAFVVTPGTSPLSRQYETMAGRSGCSSGSPPYRRTL